MDLRATILQIIQTMPEQVFKDIEKFPYREGDVVLAGYPRSGTTWLQETLYLLHNGVDGEEASKAYIDDRVKILEMPVGVGIPGQPGIYNTEVLKKSPSPRLIKTHLWAEMFTKALKETPVKVIYVYRNPKDAIVSQCHLLKSQRIKVLTDNQNEHFNTWMESLEWFTHIKGWYQMSQIYKENILIISYEDLVKRQSETVKSLASFCGLTLTEEQLQRLLFLTSFEEIKKNDTVNHVTCKVFDITISPFIRKGKVGDWKNHLSDEESRRIDEAVAEQLSGFDIKLEYE